MSEPFIICTIINSEKCKTAFRLLVLRFGFVYRGINIHLVLLY